MRTNTTDHKKGKNRNCKRQDRYKTKKETKKEWKYN